MQPSGVPAGPANSPGFTIMELMVVVAIVSILTGIIAVNVNKVNSQLSFARVVNKFEQDVRTAQSLSLTTTQFQDLQGALHPVAGYGIYVDTANTTGYLLYADKPPGNQQYNQSDYTVQNIAFGVTDPGVLIKQINNVNGTTASVNFSPPVPTTTLTPVPAAGSIEVVFALASDPSQTKTVSVNAAGLIEVK